MVVVVVGGGTTDEVTSPLVPVYVMVALVAESKTVVNTSPLGSGMVVVTGPLLPEVRCHEPPPASSARPQPRRRTTARALRYQASESVPVAYFSVSCLELPWAGGATRGPGWLGCSAIEIWDRALENHRIRPGRARYRRAAGSSSWDHARARERRGRRTVASRTLWAAPARARGHAALDSGRHVRGLREPVSASGETAGSAIAAAPSAAS